MKYKLTIKIQYGEINQVVRSVYMAEKVVRQMKKSGISVLSYQLNKLGEVST